MSKQTQNPFGGIKIRNDDQISQTLFCELCKLLLFNPTQILCCGTRLCQWCSNKGVPNNEPFVCPFCDLKQDKKEIRVDRGIERELNMIKIECYSCSWNGSYKDYKEHLQENHTNLKCDDCNECFFTINSFEEHRQEICEYRCIPCGLPNCMKMIKWSEMRTHNLNQEHQMMLLEFIIKFFVSRKHWFNYPDHSTIKSNIDSKMNEELATIIESFDLLLRGVENLSSDCIRLKSEHDEYKIGCERMILNIGEVREIMNETNEKVNKHIQSYDEMEKELYDTKKLYSSTKTLSLDNDCTITFSFHKLSNEMNSPFSLDSSIFKTSPFGYPFILRICSNIESENQNQKYLSIYITLLRGEYDQILFYPFLYNISFCLCDQSGQKKDIISTIKPDPKSSSFARPINGKNDEVGIIKFCPLNYLTDVNSIYSKDGVFFVRVSIDFMNSSESQHTKLQEDIT